MTNNISKFQLDVSEQQKSNLGSPHGVVAAKQLDDPIIRNYRLVTYWRFLSTGRQTGACTSDGGNKRRRAADELVIICRAALIQIVLEKVVPVHWKQHCHIIFCFHISKLSTNLVGSNHTLTSLLMGL